jgi:chromosome segregation ATPase
MTDETRLHNMIVQRLDGLSSEFKNDLRALSTKLDSDMRAMSTKIENALRATDVSKIRLATNEKSIARVQSTTELHATQINEINNSVFEQTRQTSELRGFVDAYKADCAKTDQRVTNLESSKDTHGKCAELGERLDVIDKRRQDKLEARAAVGKTRALVQKTGTPLTVSGVLLVIWEAARQLFGGG